MRRRPGTFLRDRSGATAVEFAIVLVPLATLLFGGVEFARMAWARQALQQTAIAGARCMGLLASNCASSGVYSVSAAKSFLAAQASGLGITIPAANMTLNRSATCAGTGNFSSVTLTYRFNTVAPVLVSALAGGADLTATACFPNNI